MEETQALKPLTPGGLVPALNPTLVTDGAGLDKVKKYFERIAEQQKNPEFALDYESNIRPSFADRTARLLALGDKNEQYIIDFLPFAGSTEKLISGQGNFKTSSWAKPIVDVLTPALDSNAFLKVGQRLGFEYQVSRWNFGMYMWNFYSTDFAERLIWAGLHTFKDVNFYSMAGMAARYFSVEIDKSHQKTFDLETPLTDEEVIYSCFDLRVPLAIRALQVRKLRTDQLERITKIENDAIGFFEDIHLHGWNIDRKTWRDVLVAEWKEKYRDSIKRLDTHFLPVVGPKDLSEENLDPLLDAWKTLTLDSEVEKETKALIRATKDPVEKQALKDKLAAHIAARKSEAKDAKDRYMDLRKRITANKKVVEKCEGEAAINYGSGAQVLKALHKMKGFSHTNLPNTDDGTLTKLKHKPVIEAFRDYRTYAKMLETYGEQWTTHFKDHPSAEEGWVNPITGKIHSTINQLEAETGRTSSVKPNIQNLPADERVRSCFIADPPNEEIRVSVCCDEDTEYDAETEVYGCLKCGNVCETKAEEYVIVTCDMSGAELRIIAEESGSKVWIDAFNNGWDVHSVGTELLYPEEWPASDQSGQTVINKKGIEEVLPPCAYFHNDHQKCKCPKHLALRDGNKATNFLLAYGGGPQALGDAIGKSETEAAELMKKHEAANPEVWAYLENSGKQAVRELESRSRCGRRRQFRRPDWEAATEQAKERMFESLKKKGKLELADGTKLKLEDMYPQKWQVNSALRGIYGSIERRGKNHKIQSLNKTIIALASGSGFDPDGKPYLWHILRRKDVRGKAKNMVHDELVIQFPKHKANEGLAHIQDAFKRAGAEFLKMVVMESEGRIAPHWKK